MENAFNNTATQDQAFAIARYRLVDLGPNRLIGGGKSWNDEECLAFADEYDRYLIYAAGQLRSGAPVAEVVDYLVQIETEHMGLGERPTSREKVQAVVAAIRDDDQLWTYPDG